MGSAPQTSKRIVVTGPTEFTGKRLLYKLDENGSGIELKSIEHFKGPMLIFAKMIFLPSRLHTLTLKLLNAIKIEAEGNSG